MILNTNREEWRKTYCADDYEVSSFGRVRSLPGRVKSCHGATAPRRGKVLKPVVKRQTGYARVMVHRKVCLVHILVARAFCGGYKPGLVVDHIDCVRTNNKCENLRWVETGFNTSRPYKEFGLRGSAYGKYSADAMKVTPIIAMNMATGAREIFDCAMDAVRKYGFDSGAISRRCTGKYKSHHGWTFTFASGTSGFPWHCNRA